MVPIPDATTGEWTTLYGRGLRTPRHCYLPGPLRGVLNYQAARSSSEVILTESVMDALSFLQAGVMTAIPIYGTNGFTADHFDVLKREQVRRVILALDGDVAGRKATAQLKEKLAAAGPCCPRDAVPAEREGRERAARLVQRQRARRLREVPGRCRARGPRPPAVAPASEPETASRAETMAS